MDFEPAEPASSRRSLLGAAGIAGLVGTAVAVLGDTVAAAATPPNRPTDADRAALIAALRLELAAVGLYEIAAAELGDDVAPIASLMAAQHGAYVDSIAGSIGASWSQLEPADVLDQLAETFATSDVQAFGAAGRTLEKTAVATHTQLLGEYDSIDAIGLTASIITVEARHAVVLTSLAGFASNLDEMLGNDAVALSLTGGAA